MPLVVVAKCTNFTNRLSDFFDSRTVIIKSNFAKQHHLSINLVSWSLGENFYYVYLSPSSCSHGQFIARHITYGVWTHFYIMVIVKKGRIYFRSNRQTKKHKSPLAVTPMPSFSSFDEPGCETVFDHVAHRSVDISDESRTKTKKKKKKKQTSSIFFNRSWPMQNDKLTKITL